MVTGRPSDYRQEYCEALIKHMAEGNSFWSFASVVSVCFKTLGNWCNEHDEFLQAKNIGLAKLLAFDEKVARAGSTGQLKRHAKTIKTTKHNEETGESVTTEEQIFDAANFSQTYQIFLMKNRYPKLYRDKITLETETSDPRKVQDTFNEVMSDPTLAEAAMKIAEKFSSGE